MIPILPMTRISTFKTSLVFLAVVIAISCQSADKYRKPAVADSTGAPQIGSLAVTGTPEQLRIMKAYGKQMDIADSIWGNGEREMAFARTDSLRQSAEAMLDTISLDEQMTKFLLVYVTNCYDRMISWHQELKDTAVAGVYTRKFEALAAHLQQRRDSAAKSKTP